MNKIIVTPMEEQDVEQVKTMLVEFYDYLNELGYLFKLNKTRLDEFVRLQLASRLSRVLLAKEDGGAAGFVAVNAPLLNKKYVVEGTRSIGVISEIYVLPEHRGKGVGKELFAAASDYLKSLGVDYVMAEIVENNKLSASLFESLDFEPFFSCRIKKI